MNGALVRHPQTEQLSRLHVEGDVVQGYHFFDFAPEDADGPYSFVIDYDDGTIPFSGSSSLNPLELTHVFATAGTHRVEISVWNCEAVLPETDTVYVPVRGAKNEIYLPLISKD
jgi:hypothetical protein